MSFVQKGGYRGGRSYLLIDDRVSGGERKEFDTMTCAHCGKMVVLNNSRQRPRGHCNRCSRYVCDPCYDFARLGIDNCVFFEEMIDVAFNNQSMAGIRELAFLNHGGRPSEAVKALVNKQRIIGVGFSGSTPEQKTDSGIILAKK